MKQSSCVFPGGHQSAIVWPDKQPLSKGICSMQGAGDCGGRRILSIFPHYTSSFGMFEHAYPLMGGVRALMPPQGLLVVMAALPASWENRLWMKMLSGPRSTTSNGPTPSS